MGLSDHHSCHLWNYYNARGTFHLLLPLILSTTLKEGILAMSISQVGKQRDLITDPKSLVRDRAGMPASCAQSVRVCVCVCVCFLRYTRHDICTSVCMCPCICTVIPAQGVYACLHVGLCQGPGPSQARLSSWGHQNLGNNDPLENNACVF